MTDKSHKEVATIPWIDGSYTGEVLDGGPHGHGTLNFSDGSVYVGEWKAGLMHGQGTETTTDESRNKFTYVGTWRDGFKEGQGTMYGPNGSRYVGNWTNNKRSGHGLFESIGELWKFGMPMGRYVGEFREGKRHGHGRYDFWEKFPGESLQKKWLHGPTRDVNANSYPVNLWLEPYVYHTSIKYVPWQSGTTILAEPWGFGGREQHKQNPFGPIYVDYYRLESYTGDFCDDLPHGVGIVKYQDGGQYVGQIVEGRFHGFGVAIDATGHRYAGNWYRGLKQGYGIASYVNGSEYAGEWRFGTFEGEGIWKHPGNNMFCWEVHTNKPVNGELFTDQEMSGPEGDLGAGGSRTEKMSILYAKNLTGNQRQDEEWLESIREIYRGSFSQGYFEGAGIYTSHHGKYSGIWKRGQLIDGSQIDEEGNEIRTWKQGSYDQSEGD